MIIVTRQQCSMYILIGTAIQLILYLVRQLQTHYNYAFLMRFQHVVFIETCMIPFDVIVWNRISSLIFRRHTTIRIGLTITDIWKSMLMLFLVLAHTCFALFYVSQAEDPHWYAQLSFFIFALYVHFSILFFACNCWEYLMSWITKERRGKDLLAKIFLNRRLHTALSLVLAVTLVLVGIRTTSHPPTVHKVKVPIRNLPSFLYKKRIALLTDIHIGPTVGRTRMKEIVAVVSLEKPDLIAIAGDLYDGHLEQLSRAAEPLRRLSAPYGVYFATGNHEYYHGHIHEWLDYLTKMGIVNLRNQNVRLKKNGQKSTSKDERALCIAGIDDITAAKTGVKGHAMNVTAALAGCSVEDTVILLAHQPAAARIALKSHNAERIDLILSGHVHAGQMYVTILFAYLTNPYYHGLYKHESGAHVYVSAGVNFWGPPVKIHDLTEVTIIELVPNGL